MSFLNFNIRYSKVMKNRFDPNFKTSSDFYLAFVFVRCVNKA